MRNANRIAIVIALLLVVASLLFVYGSSSNRTQPSTVNTRGLGLAAYAELLRQSNIPVQIERSPVISVSPKDVIVVSDSDGWTNRLIAPEPEFTDSESEVSSVSREQLRLEESIQRHLKKGGRILNLVFYSNAEPQPPSQQTTFKTVNGTRSFVISQPDEPFLFSSEDYPEAVPILATDEGFSIFLYDYKPGIELNVSEAGFLRNRYIADAQNAELGIWLAKQFLPPGGKIVFAEASAGNVENLTALGELGRWAPAAFGQFLLTLAIAVFTINRRFGLPARELTKARGAKELMSAMSLTLQRANRRDHALLILRANAIDRVRKTLRLSAGMTEQEVISQMPPDAQAAMSSIIRLQGRDIDRKEALRIAQTLDQNLRQIEEQEKARRAPQ